MQAPIVQRESRSVSPRKEALLFPYARSAHFPSRGTFRGELNSGSPTRELLVRSLSATANSITCSDIGRTLVRSASTTNGIRERTSPRSIVPRGIGSSRSLGTKSIAPATTPLGILVFGSPKPHWIKRYWLCLRRSLTASAYDAATCGRPGRRSAQIPRCTLKRLVSCEFAASGPRRTKDNGVKLPRDRRRGGRDAKINACPRLDLFQAQPKGEIPGNGNH